MKTKKGIQTIIVGVDLSRYSKTVVKQARHLSQHLKVPLVYFYAFEDPLSHDWQHTLFDDEIKKYFSSKIRNHYGLTKNDAVVIKRGKAYRQLMVVSDTFVRPLIVIGHRGQSAISRFFLGSTAERLALHSKHPVWIHRGNKIVTPKKIMIPADFSDRSKLAIESTQKLNIPGAKIELHHIRQPPPPPLDYQYWQLLDNEIEKVSNAEITKLKKKFAPLKVYESKNSDVPGSLQKQAKKYDLISIAPRSKHGPIGTFGSVTSKVVRSGNVPVLITPSMEAH